MTEEREKASPESDDENRQERFLGHLGQQGSGKTYALEEDTLERFSEQRRILVVDNKREWTAIPSGVPVCEVCAEPGKERERGDCKASHTCVVAPDLEKALKRLKEHGFAVLRPPRDRRLGPPRRDEITLIERVCNACLDTGDLDLVIPEAHMVLPLEDEAAMGMQTRQLITQYRVYGIAVAWDSQFFANVSIRLRKSTNTYRLFGFAGGTPDMEQARKMGGPALVKCLEECAKRHAAGQPGWHVFIDPREPASNPAIERF